MAASAKACPVKPPSMLALSGGGDDGAFGAGYLVGWSARGDRPSFDVVTGVSTGALIAPMAFLGARYDKALKRFYTETSEGDIYVAKPILAGLFGDSLVDPEPLRRRIAETVDRKLVRAIALEHRKGRRLLVVTTNLDAQRPVIWDIGAIALTGTSQALSLIREILLASASLPGLFPPVYIDASAVSGRSLRELHVDGGTTMQILAVPESFLVHDDGLQCGPSLDLHVIVNGRLTPEFVVVEGSTFPIAERSLSTLLKGYTKLSLATARALAENKQLTLDVAAIGSDFEAPTHRKPFDPVYMGRLFDYGLKKGLNPD